MQTIEIQKPFTQEVKRKDGNSSFIRHVDARYSPEARDEVEEILKGQRISRASNRKFNVAKMRDYSVGAPNLTRVLNQRQKRKRAKH